MQLAAFHLDSLNWDSWEGGGILFAVAVQWASASHTPR